MAASIGQSINIPIVIRRVAADWYRHVPKADAAFLLDPEFLRSLDAGTNQDDPAKVVKSYHHQWWTARSSPPMTDLLNAANIADFLDHHRKICGIDETVTDIPFKPSYGWSRGVTFQSVSPNIQCNECRLYRGISIGTLDDLRDLRHFAHGMEVRFATQSQFAARRAANLYQLYHAASMKNTPDPTSVASTRKGKSVSPEQVRTRAQAEWVRLSELPINKWTPRCPLSTEEVLEVLKPHPHSGRVHSGYVKYLPWGSHGESSDAPMTASPQECDWYSIISPSSNDYDHPPLSPRQRPVHFEYPPLRDLHGEPPRPDESVQVIEAVPRAPPTAFHVPDPPVPFPHDNPHFLNHSVTVSSEEVGPSGAFPLVDGVSHNSNSVSASGEGEPTDALADSEGSDPDSDSASKSDSSHDIGPTEALGDSQGKSCLESDSGSDIYEVTAIEAAAALADSGSDLIAGGMVLTAVLTGRLAVEGLPSRTSDPINARGSETQPRAESDSGSDICEVTAMEAADALADSDSDLGDGGMVLAALLGGQLAVETLPPRTTDPVINPPFTGDSDSDSGSNSSHEIGPAAAFGDSIVPPGTPDHVSGGLFTTAWFAALPPELLYVSSDEE